MSYVKFTPTSRDLLIHGPHAEVFTYILVRVFRQGIKYLKKALLRANCKECLIAELIRHASVPQSKIDKHLLFISANITYA